MKFKTDENLPLEAAAILRDAGFDAETVSDENLSGVEDQNLAFRVRSENRILITLNLDGELWIVERDRIRYRRGL